MRPGRAGGHRSLGSAALVGVVTASVLLATTGSAQAAASDPPLGAADSFAVLAGAGVSNTGTTILNGDLGTFPTTTVTGASTLTVNGSDHGGDAVTQQAKTDLVTAYDAAAAQSPRTPISADLGGMTLTPGVYGSASSLGVTGTLTLDGGGDPSSVFVFQAGSTLVTANNSQVVLTNGAQACHVFFQVGSSATLGTASLLQGSVLALTSATLATGAQVQGRVLARNGAVTLDSNTITRPSCLAPTAPTASVSPSATATATATVPVSPAPAGGPVVGPTTTPVSPPTSSPTASPAAASPSPTAAPAAGPAGPAAAPTTATATPSPAPSSSTAPPAVPIAPVTGAGPASTAPAAPGAPVGGVPTQALPTGAAAPLTPTSTSSSTSQVANVPAGPVQAGGGPAPEPVLPRAPLAIGVALAGAAFTLRARRRVS